MLRGIFELLTLALQGAWIALRMLSGDDAYDRYLAARNQDERRVSPVTRAEHFEWRVAQKWDRYFHIGR